MTTDSAVDARAHARVLIGRALKSTGAAFDTLEKRLRLPYAQALTEEDRDDIRAYVNVHVDSLFELLRRHGPEPVWTDDSDTDGDTGDTGDGDEPGPA